MAGERWAISGSGTTTSAQAPGPPSITFANAIPAIDGNGNPIMRVTVTVTPPIPLGSTSGFWFWNDEPDHSVNGGVSITDGTQGADGTVGAGGLFNPRAIGFREYNGDFPTYSFDAPVVSSAQYYRVYVSAGSAQITPRPIQHGQAGETPSRQYLVEPIPDTTSKNGREFAPLMRNVVLAPAGDFNWASNPVYITDDYGVQSWDVGISWEWPTNDPDYASLAGFNLVLVGPETRNIGIVPKDEDRVEGVLGTRFVVLPGNTTYILYAVSVSATNTNTIVPNVTPGVTINISRSVGPAGEEYTSVATGVSFTLTPTTGSDGTMQLAIMVTGTTPAPIADPSFGGVRLRLKRPSDTTPVTLTQARTLPLLWPVQKPSTSQSWILSLTSLSTDGRENTIVPGTTPQLTTTVGGGTDLNLGFAGSGFDTGPFQVSSGVFKLTTVAANYLIGGALQIGGPGMISISKFFDSLGSLIGWCGDNLSDPNPSNRYLGQWWKQTRFGGTNPTNAPFQCDSSGNLTISIPSGNTLITIDATNIFQIQNTVVNYRTVLDGLSVLTGQVTGGRRAVLSSGGSVQGVDLSGTWTLNSSELRMDALPTSSPGAGTKQFWYDPSDSNRVKFQP